MKEIEVEHIVTKINGERREIILPKKCWSLLEAQEIALGEYGDGNNIIEADDCDIEPSYI